MPERGGMFLDFDRVTDQDGWVWMRLTHPWVSGRFADDSAFHAGFADFDHAHADMAIEVGGADVSSQALLKGRNVTSRKFKSGLVLGLPLRSRPFAYAIFPIRRGLAPDREGPALFAKWKSAQSGAQSMLRAGKPLIWPL